jgi:tagatose 1,6-diphosphate aldolase
LISPGKYRHLAQSSTPAGHFVVLAIDHRANLLAALNQHAPQPVTDGDFVAFKQAVLAALLPGASAVLTDPDYGIGPGLTAGTIGGQVGLLAPLEVTNYDVHPRDRATRFIDGWSVGKIKRVGGSGVKLLLYYHPDDSLATGKRELVSRIVADCQRFDIPLFLEPIAYSLDPDRGLSADEHLQVVVESARTFSALGVDVLKLEFPVNPRHTSDESVWRTAAQAVNAACSVPWAILSGGVDYPTFARQAAVACAAGACGVIVGRALWGEAVELQGAARQSFLETTATARMSELQAICAASASSWQSRLPALELAARWYTTYPE